MKLKLKLSFCLVSVLLVLLPFSVAPALVIDPSVVLDVVKGNHHEIVGPFKLLMIDGLIDEGISYSTINAYRNSLSSNWNEPNQEISSLLPNSNFLEAWGASNEIGLASIPPAVLLFGAGLIGFICIARRSFFTK